MNRSSAVDEGKLTVVCQQLNDTYFDGSVHIYRIAPVRFLRDLTRPQVTYGLFDYQPHGSRILINRYLFLPWVLKKYPWIISPVVYHELVHAYLILNMFPYRFGQHFCASHGPEFWTLMLRHPKAKAWERVMKKITPTIRQRILFAGRMAKAQNSPAWKRLQGEGGGFMCREECA